MGLTPKNEAFAAGVAQGLSQSEAYRRAFPRASKWKDETVWQYASRLAGDVKVVARVRELQERAAKANQITVDRIVAEVAKIAFGDARRVMTWGPDGVELLPSDALPDSDAAIVSEVSETVTQFGGSLKLKTHDKLGALKLLADITGAVVRKTELTGKDGKDLVPQAPNGVLVVPGVMTATEWETMMKGGGKA